MLPVATGVYSFRRTNHCSLAHHPIFFGPLFSYSYELLFPQPLYFDNDLNCPGVWGARFQFSTLCLRVSVANPVPKSCRVILLRTLCRSQKSQLLCNQANPNSLRKIRGGGVCLRATPRSLRLGVIISLRFVPLPSPAGQLLHQLLQNQHLQKCIKTNNFIFF